VCACMFGVGSGVDQAAGADKNVRAQVGEASPSRRKCLSQQI
jgi:hypothetical protein